ncbi:MAG: endopeptidase La, partial [Thermotogae bacterium]
MKSRFEKLEKLAKRNEERLKIPGILPLIPLRSEIVAFPRMVVPIHVLRESSLVPLEAAPENSDQPLLVTNQKDFSHERLSFEDVDLIGTVCRILKLARFPDGSFKVL